MERTHVNVQSCPYNERKEGILLIGCCDKYAWDIRCMRTCNILSEVVNNSIQYSLTSDELFSVSNLGFSLIYSLLI